MRIVFVISHLIYGGAETQLINLARELARRGHAVTVYTLNAHNPRAAELEGTNVELIADQKRHKLDWAVVTRLHRYIKFVQADVVHGFLFDGDLYSRLASLGTGAITINSERSANYALNFNQKLSHYPTRRLVHAVVANSHAGARFAQRLFGVPPERVHTVWNGIDYEQISCRVAKCHSDISARLFGKSGLKLACLVGNIKPSKDYELALHVADRLTKIRRDWRVVFVGDQLGETGEYKRAIMRVYDKLHLHERATFTGLRDDVPEIVSCCRVLYSTSAWEGFPNVVLEAMAVGTPVISAEYSDIRQILPRYWQVVSDRRAEAFIRAILRADQFHDEVASEQRAWVIEHATMTKVATKLEGIYFEYLAR